MGKIELTKDEKKVMRLLYKHGQDSLDTMPRSIVRRSLRRLESISFVRVAWVEGGDFEAVMLTRDGKDYLIENPRLINPVNWTKIAAIGAIVAAIAAVIGLFISCSLILK